VHQTKLKKKKIHEDPLRILIVTSIDEARKENGYPMIHQKENRLYALGGKKRKTFKLHKSIPFMILMSAGQKREI
jgi:hypothetical protein